MSFLSVSAVSVSARSYVNFAGEAAAQAKPASFQIHCDITVTRFLNYFKSAPFYKAVVYQPAHRLPVAAFAEAGYLTFLSFFSIRET